MWWHFANRIPFKSNVCCVSNFTNHQLFANIWLPKLLLFLAPIIQHVNEKGKAWYPIVDRDMSWLFFSILCANMIDRPYSSPLNLLSSSSVSSVAFLTASKNRKIHPGKPNIAITTVGINPILGSPPDNSKRDPAPIGIERERKQRDRHVRRKHFVRTLRFHEWLMWRHKSPKETLTCCGNAKNHGSPKENWWRNRENVATCTIILLGSRNKWCCRFRWCRWSFGCCGRFLLWQHEYRPITMLLLVTPKCLLAYRSTSEWNRLEGINMSYEEDK